MKTRLPLLYLGFFVCCALFFTSRGYSQINYSQDFEDDDPGWSNDQFVADNVFLCNGSYSWATEAYSFWGLVFPTTTISESIGISNGQPATLTYSYKLTDYYTYEGILNDPEWGSVVVDYGTTPGGPWINLETITPDNHTESSNCQVRTVNFTPPAASHIYLRITVNPSAEWDTDVIADFDDINVVQGASLACAGTPQNSTTIASDLMVCNTGDVTLSLNPYYITAGLNFQWQSSSDNINYTNVPTGGTTATYTTTQTVATWYRAKISCSAGGDEVTSTPVHVLSSGLDCICDVVFEYTVEPITHVVFAGIDNSSSNIINGSPDAENFTHLTPGQVTRGETYEIALEGNTNDPTWEGYETYFTVFIDWNHDFEFSDNEKYDIDYIYFSDGEDGVQAIGNIAVPEDAMTGLTNMRIFKLYNAFPDTACGTNDEYGYGQAEDYFINVQSGQTIGWANLQSPSTMTFNAGGSGTAYARVYAEGVTEAAGAGAGITAWIGISPAGSNTNPNTWTTWVPAAFNVQSGNNDEFMAAIGTGLAPGTYYYASRFQLDGGTYSYGGFNAGGGGFWDGTANVSGVLTVTCGTPAPTVNHTSVICAGSTLADLDAEGANESDTIIWYSAATGGTALPASTILVDNTTYHAAAMPEGGCESTARTAVTVDITTTAAPTTDEATQTFCNEADLGDLEVDGDGEIVWYAAETGGTALDEDAPVTSGTTYYAAQVINGCESSGRTAVTAQITVTGLPSGDQTQEIEVGSANDATIEDIEVTATGTVKWYATEEDAEEGENALAEGTVITSGTYYATQTIDGCESIGYAVTVDVTLGNGEFSTASFTYHPNPVNDILSLSYDKTILAIEVYNIVGQKVIAKSVNQNQAQVDMSQLAAGTYMVKVMSDTASKTIKVVKL